MKYSRRTILFNCACFLTDCNACKLADIGCSDAPIAVLAEEARKNYLRAKKDKDWKYYDKAMTDNFGKDYAKNFMVTKAKVV